MAPLLHLLSAAALLTLAAAHSHIDYLIINGLQYPGFDPKIPNNTPNVVGWSTSASDDGFVPPSNYSTPDIICHRDGAPVTAHAPVHAGEQIFIQWNGWPQSHDGPALSYLASCGGKADGCASVDKTELRWFKFDDSRPAFINETGGPPGKWTSDVLIAANNSWTIEIPPTLAPGAYVLRHELIALHYAYQDDGAQNYPQCFNLWVLPPKTASTSTKQLTLDPADGAVATEMYHADDPGIDIDIFTSRTTYVIPGPTVIPEAVMLTYSLQHSQLPTADGTPVLVTGTTGTVAAPSTGTLKIGARAEMTPAPKRHWERRG
jgi:lytic cellulose monooxygenase (C1-hydroxylating)